MPAGEIFRERVGREPKESAAIDFWTYQHSAPFYKAQLVFENGHLVGGAWWDQDTTQPSSAPAAHKFGMPGENSHKHHHKPPPPPSADDAKP